MKTKDFAALGRRLLPALPGFRVEGDMIFMHPIAHILRGICFDGSSFDAKLFLFMFSCNRYSYQENISR